MECPSAGKSFLPELADYPRFAPAVPSDDYAIDLIGKDSDLTPDKWFGYRVVSSSFSWWVPFDRRSIYPRNPVSHARM